MGSALEATSVAGGKAEATRRPAGGVGSGGISPLSTASTTVSIGNRSASATSISLTLRTASCVALTVHLLARRWRTSAGHAEAGAAWISDAWRS